MRGYESKTRSRAAEGWLHLGTAAHSPQVRGRKTLSYIYAYHHLHEGQIVLPAEFRAVDGVKAGEEFEVDRIGPDEYRLTRLTPPPNRGVVEWLRSCPDDGWFVEIESESTDSL
jgi:bifunctional DNA-binding transcriptional regulator/antitoxin component of YhaV-PrlF toxin-antitoxin module